MKKVIGIFCLLTIVLKDKTEAQNRVNISINENDEVSGTVQKVLKDDDSGETLNDGDPITLTLTADQQSQVISALAPVLSAAFNAQQ